MDDNLNTVLDISYKVSKLRDQESEANYQFEKAQRDFRQSKENLAHWRSELAKQEALLTHAIAIASISKETK